MPNTNSEKSTSDLSDVNYLSVKSGSAFLSNSIFNQHWDATIIPSNYFGTFTDITKIESSSNEKLITKFLNKEKGKFSKYQMFEFNQIATKIINRFSEYNVGIELTPSNSIFFTLLYEKVEIHIETFLSEDNQLIDNEFYYSLYVADEYLYNGSGLLTDLITQIKSDLAELIMDLDAVY